MPCKTKSRRDTILPSLVLQCTIIDYRNSERTSKRGSAGSGGFRRGSGTGKKEKAYTAGCHSGTRARFRKRALMVDDVDAGAEGAQLAPIMWRRLRTRKQSIPFRARAIGKRRCGVARLSSILDRLVKAEAEVARLHAMVETKNCVQYAAVRMQASRYGSDRAAS